MNHKKKRRLKRKYLNTKKKRRKEMLKTSKQMVKKVMLRCQKRKQNPMISRRWRVVKRSKKNRAYHVITMKTQTMTNKKLLSSIKTMKLKLKM